jgi:hypothetical protein
MRTTISLQNDTLQQIKVYIKRMKTVKIKTTLSSIIEESLHLSLPLLLGRAPNLDESDKDFSLRRIKQLKQIIKQTKQTDQKMPYVFELSKIQVSAYQKGFIKKIENLPITYP